MEPDRQRLDQRALGVAHAVGQPEGERRGVDHRRGQAAVYRRGRPEAHGGVEVVEPQPGRLAVRVGDARLHADAVAHMQVLHRAAHLDHRAGGLVPQDHRLAHDERADRPVLIVVHIAAAHAHRVDRDADS